MGLMGLTRRHWGRLFYMATLVLEGGWTSHSVFKILIAIGRDSMCSILVQSDCRKLEFPRLNHGLKFLALDAKMVATEVMFTTCSCSKHNAS
jgi:hypothetical protein